jgi:hypothetical protein
VEQEGVPITTALIIWKSPMTGEVSMLVINKALYFSDSIKMESLLKLLLCPEEIERYQTGLLQEVELTEDAPWEPYFMKFTETEAAALTAHSVMALRVQVPCCLMDSATHSSKEEEEYYPQHSPILTEHCIAVAS